MRDIEVQYMVGCPSLTGTASPTPHCRVEPDDHDGGNEMTW
jgi:hypothetical protein